LEECKKLQKQFEECKIPKWQFPNLEEEEEEEEELLKEKQFSKNCFCNFCKKLQNTGAVTGKIRVPSQAPVTGTNSPLHSLPVKDFFTNSPLHSLPVKDFFTGGMDSYLSLYGALQRPSTDVQPTIPEMQSDYFDRRKELAKELNSSLAIGIKVKPLEWAKYNFERPFLWLAKRLTKNGDVRRLQNARNQKKNFS